MRYALAISLVLCLGAVVHAQVAPRGAITISATGFRSDDGNLRCFLYDRAEDFPTHPDRAYAGAMGRISGGRASCTFDDIPAGRYAIALHHDQDADGQVDTGLFGIPTEGLGASNEAHGTMGPPSFADAAFDHAGTPLSLRSRIGYVF